MAFDNTKFAGTLLATVPTKFGFTTPLLVEGVASPATVKLSTVLNAELKDAPTLATVITVSASTSPIR